MELALDFMKEKYATLINDYRTPDNMYSESCGLIAVEMAEKFLSEGYIPHIRTIEGFLSDEVGNRTSLVPKLYDYRVIWSAHHVCCVGEDVYDPMLGRKISLTDYLSEAFENDCEMTISVSEENIREFIQR